MAEHLRKFDTEKDSNSGNNATVTFQVPDGAVGVYLNNDGSVDYEIRAGSSGDYIPFSGGTMTPYLEVSDADQVQLHDQADTDVGEVYAIWIYGRTGQ